jgi:dipeptidyl aminopeptidase/acylaminoacyl peptidase
MPDVVGIPLGRSVLVALAACCLLWARLSWAQEGYQQPDPALASLVEAPLTPAVSLSPDRQHLVLMERPGLPGIEELAEEELRLAGLRFNPRNSGPTRTRSYTGLTFRALQGNATRPVTGLPGEARIRNVQWAPDSRHVAFTVDRTDRIDLYVADGRAHRVLDAAVHDVYYGTPFAWISDGQTLLVRTVPEGRGTPPTASHVPGGPVIQENLGKTAPARTYQDLLQNPHDAAVFEHYMTAQLVVVALDGVVRQLGAPRLITSASPSPDGTFVLVESIHRPFSYLVPAYRFPRRIEVLDRDGDLVREVADLPLAEEVPLGFESVPTGVRSIGWRADAPATLAWVEALDDGDARKEADVRDRVYLLPAPFTAEPTPLITLPLRYGGIRWGDDDLALVTESWWSTRKERVYVVDPSQPAQAPRVLFDLSFEDRYNDPGSPLMTPTEQGTSVLLTDGAAIFLSGEGASPEGNRPFLRRMNVATGEVEERFRSTAPYYEEPVALLDPQTLLTRREAVAEPPNYFLRDLQTDVLTPLTDFPHPYPELAEIQKEFIVYDRADGLQLSATLYLPAGYDAERDGPLPGLVWAYPREFKSADAAGQIADSPYRFNWVSYWGAVPYVTQGYAVFDDTSMPIVGEGEAEPNDSFVDQLVMNAQAVIDEGVRRGVLDAARVGIAGHSYGAFMTANLLAHSDLFRAGIARSGAYNRTLTPFGFQAEERTYWEAPEVYYTMSPFMHADEVDEPILLIHGAADNNSGTFPMQSERFYNALKGMGKTARLVMLPLESHGYQARESVLHMLWETNRWLEAYVKQGGAQPTDAPARLPDPSDAEGSR